MQSENGQTLVSSSEHAFRLPEPEYRHVAGHVSRRHDNPPPHLPPPSIPRQTNPTISSKKSGQDRNSRRKPGHGDGDGSDSDSDQDRRPDRGEDDVGIASQRPRLRKSDDRPMVHHPHPRDDPGVFRPRDIPGSLQYLEINWYIIHEQRRQNREEGLAIRRKLLHYLHFFWSKDESNKSPSDGPYNPLNLNPMLDKIKAWETKTGLFLDKGLKSPMESNSHEMSREYYEVIIERIENEIIWRLDAFMPSARNHEVHETCLEGDLVRTFKSLYRYLWPRIPKEDCNRESVVKSASQLMKDKCQTAPTPRSLDLLVDSYLIKVIDGFVDTFLKHEGFSREIPKIGCFQQLQVMNRSRHWDRNVITYEYVDWVRTGIEQILSKQCCLEIRQEAKVEIVKRWGLRVDFIMNTHGFKGVFWVLLGKNGPIAVREVSHSEMCEMGWQINFDSGVYSRFEFYRDETRDGIKNGIFAVSIEGKVLGIWDPQKKEVMIV